MAGKWSSILVAVLICSVTNAQKIKSIKIVSVPLYVTSTFDISCIQFDKSFDGMKKEFLVTRYALLRDVQELSKKFSSINSNSVDVRGKLFVRYHNGKNKVICFDEFGHFFKDDSFYENKPLFNYLLKHHFIDPYGN